MANTTYDTIKNMKPAPWSRSTVADGNALNQNFLEPTHQKDLTLAAAIDQVKNTVDGYNETINNISNVADAAKTQATNAISTANEAQDAVEELQTTVTEMSDAVSAHGESIETLGINFNTLSAAVAGEAEAIGNLQNNKQDKIYVDTNTISGNGTSGSPYTVIGWSEIDNWFMNRFQFENGVSGIPDMTNYKMLIGLSGDYLPTSGGTISGDVIIKSTGTNILAINTTATLMGQSRVNSLTDTTAIGTNWLGVNINGGGFLKNVQGGNVGDLNGTSIQIDFAPDGANSYGNITVNSQNNESKIINVPTASYNSMTTFDPTNGPNYMLRKTASGFDIGAKVVNVTSMPQNTEANTYYFVYEV